MSTVTHDTGLKAGTKGYLWSKYKQLKVELVYDTKPGQRFVTVRLLEDYLLLKTGDERTVELKWFHHVEVTT